MLFSALISGLPEGPTTFPEGEPPLSLFEARKRKAQAERRPIIMRRSRLQPDPIADLKACGCLRCKIIAVVLEDQRPKHDGKWSTTEVFHGLAEAAAFFCQEVKDQLGADSGDPVGDLATLVAAKMAERAEGLMGKDSSAGMTVH